MSSSEDGGGGGGVFDEYARIDGGGWGAEFDHIVETCKRYTYTAVEARRPENAAYNRYMDICPYDHSRVVVARTRTGYINANAVGVERAAKRYILTQGPTHASTPHFWRMIWEQRSRAIVMLNKRVENERVKCSLYWPPQMGAEHALLFPDVALRVEQLTEERHAHYSTRIIKVTDIETTESREVIQFHYTTWPDFGVPSSPTAFLKFLYAVRASGAMDPSVGPPVVHCSAGVGRSGTFCLVDSCLVLIEKYGAETVNVREVLLEMRRYRMGLIQTPDQLRFSYQAIIKGSEDLLRGDNIYKQNGDEDIYDVPSKDDDEAPPPVPPPRAASLKIDPTSNNESSDSSDDEEEIKINGDNAHVDEYNPPMKDLPDVPDSEEDSEEEDEVEVEDESLLLNKDLELNDSSNSNHVDTPELPEKEGLRRRHQHEKSAKLQERVQEMKRKQQEAEEWQKKKRSFYIPMIIGLGIAIFAISYVSLKN